MTPLSRRGLLALTFVNRCYDDYREIGLETIALELFNFSLTIEEIKTVLLNSRLVQTDEDRNRVQHLIL